MKPIVFSRSHALILIFSYSHSHILISHNPYLIFGAGGGKRKRGDEGARGGGHFYSDHLKNKSGATYVLFNN